MRKRNERVANSVSGSGRRTNGGAAISPIGIGSCRGAPALLICYLTNRTGHVTDQVTDRSTAPAAGAGRRSATLLTTNQFAKPLAMVPPRPAPGDLAAGHGADGAAH